MKTVLSLIMASQASIIQMKDQNKLMRIIYVSMRRKIAAG